MNEDWPALRYEDWKDTYATLHMWSQVVGKIALTHGPALNHSWGAALHLTSRGFETAVLTRGSRQFTIQFDFVEHRLVIAAADGETRVMPLVSRSVADFYRDVMTTLEQMGLPVRIWSTPVEIDSPIRFEEDSIHHTSRSDRRKPLLAHSAAGWTRPHGLALQLRREDEPRKLLLGEFRPRPHAVFRTTRGTARWSRVHARGVLTRSDQPWILARRRTSA